MLNLKIVLLSTLLILTTITFLDVVHFQSKTATELKLVKLKKDFSIFIFEVLLIEKRKIRHTKQIAFYATLALVFICVATTELILKGTLELESLKHQLEASAAVYDKTKNSYLSHKEKLNALEKTIKENMAQRQKDATAKAKALARGRAQLSEAQIAHQRQQFANNYAWHKIEIMQQELSKKQSALTLLKTNLQQKESVWNDLTALYKNQNKTLRDTIVLTKIFLISGFWCAVAGVFETFRKEVRIKRICGAYKKDCERRYLLRLAAHKSLDVLQKNSSANAKTLRKIYAEVVKDYKAGHSLKIVFNHLSANFRNKLTEFNALWVKEVPKIKTPGSKNKKKFLSGFLTRKIKKVVIVQSPVRPPALKKLNFLRNKYFKFKNKGRN